MRYGLRYKVVHVASVAEAIDPFMAALEARRRYFRERFAEYWHNHWIRAQGHFWAEYPNVDMLQSIDHYLGLTT